MASKGKIIWKDVSANVGFSIEGSDCFITDMVNEAKAFFFKLPHGEEFELHFQGGKGLKLLLQAELPPHLYIATIRGKV